MSNINITIVGGSPWGFRMMGGSEFNLPLTVDNVTLNGKAAKCGLMVGDKIISCNGVQLEKITHSVAKANISSAKDLLVLEIYRKSGSNSSVSESAPISNDTEPKSTGSQSVVPHTPLASTSSLNKEETQSPTLTPSVSTSQVSAPSSTASMASPTTVKPVSLYPQPKNKPKVASPAVTPVSSSIVVENPQPVRKPFQDPFAFQPNTDTTNYKPAPPTTDSDPSDKVGKINILPTTGNNMFPAENSLEKICCTCKVDIGTLSYVKLGDRIWHSDHFCCSSCKKSLVGVGFLEDGDRILCKDCYGAEKGPKCTACGKPCITEYVTAANNPYHADCFICTNCKRSLRGCPFNIHNDTPHCMDCVTKLCSQQCCRCDKGIIPGEEYIEASGKLYHENCFVCKICNEPLAGKQKFTIKNGEPCCPEHH